MSKRTRKDAEQKREKSHAKDEEPVPDAGEDEDEEPPACFICNSPNQRLAHQPVCTRRLCRNKEFVHKACLEKKFAVLRVNVIQHACCQCDRKVRFEKSAEQKKVELARDSGMFALMFLAMSTVPFLLLHAIDSEKFSVPEGSLLQYLTVPLFSWTICGLLYAIGMILYYCCSCFWFPVQRLHRWAFSAHSAVTMESAEL